MVKITASPAVESAFRGIAQRAEIRDSSGALLGYFEPTEEIQRMYEEAKQLLDTEELRQIEASGGPYYTTQQVLDHLRSLEKSRCDIP